MNGAVFFDNTYPADLQAEGLAVREAIMTGKCNKCQSFRECNTNEHFVFPQDAFCMVRKNEILKGWKDGN